MRADPSDRAVVEHDDLIRVHDAADPLGHEDDRRVRRLPLERSAEHRVRLKIDGRETIVEHVDVCILDQGSGDG